MQRTWDASKEKEGGEKKKMKAVLEKKHSNMETP